jgi:hypothetical protein
LKNLNTTKLFYDEYKHRLKIRHPLGTIFRDKNLATARQILDSLQSQADRGEGLEWQRGYRYKIPVSSEQMISAQFLLSEFTAQEHINYKLRCENPSLMIYSNNLSWLNSLVNKGITALSLTQPNLANANDLVPYVIITDDNPIQYQYKITVGRRVSPSLGVWIQSNLDKCKAGTKFLELVTNRGHVNGMYFYVRDEKVLQLVRIIIGGDIKRVDKFINSVSS